MRRSALLLPVLVGISVLLGDFAVCRVVLRNAGYVMFAQSVIPAHRLGAATPALTYMYLDQAVAHGDAEADLAQQIGHGISEPNWPGWYKAGGVSDGVAARRAVAAGAVAAYYYEQGKYDLSAAWYARTGDRSLLLSLANRARDNRVWSAALAFYEQISRMDPHDAQVRRELAAIWRWGYGDRKKAIEQLQLAVAESSSIEDYLLLGNYASEAGMKSEAQQWLEKAQHIAPKDERPLILLGKNELSRGHKKEAILFLQQAIAVAPQNAQAHIQLAEVLRQQGALEDAAQEAALAIALRPGLASGYFISGLIARDKGALTESRRQIEQAIDLLSPFQEAYRAQYMVELGDVLVRMGLSEDALRIYQEALALNNVETDVASLQSKIRLLEPQP